MQKIANLYTPRIRGPSGIMHKTATTSRLFYRTQYIYDNSGQSIRAEHLF